MNISVDLGFRQLQTLKEFPYKWYQTPITFSIPISKYGRVSFYFRFVPKWSDARKSGRVSCWQFITDRYTIKPNAQS